MGIDGERFDPERLHRWQSRFAAVHADLLAAEEKIAEATRKHNEFLKELGLPLLPCADEEEAQKGAIGKGKRKAR